MVHLTYMAPNQEFGLRIAAEGRDLLRRGFFIGLFDVLEMPQSGDALPFQLRQLQQYAALLLPGLRCQCRTNGRSMLLAVQPWPCCSMFARIPPPAHLEEELLRDPWTLTLDDVSPPTP